MSIIDVIKKQRAEIDRADAATLERLARAYRAKYERMKREVEAFAAKVAAMDKPTRASIIKSREYKKTVENIEGELDDYAAYLRTEIDVTTKAGLGIGEKHALALITAAGYAGRRVNVDKLPLSVVQVMMQFLAPESQLYQRITKLAPFHAPLIADALIKAVTEGYNPITTGKYDIKPLLAIAYRALEKSAGLALTDALRMARTSQLWAYRESSRSIYVANQDVVKGWYWYAELDESTCMSCIAQHGTFHELTEQLDDHYNGRCAMIPAVIGADNPVTENGEDWFGNLSEARQRQMMGAEYYSAYQSGAFSFADLSRQVEDDTYGHMHNVTPLYELLGAEPPKRAN